MKKYIIKGKMKNKKIMNQTGAISLFVLLSMMFFLLFVLSVFSFVSNRAQIQTMTLTELQSIYQKDMESLKTIRYASGDEIIPIYTLEQYELIGTGNAAQINGKVYTLNEESSYVLKSDIIVPLEEYEVQTNDGTMVIEGEELVTYPDIYTIDQTNFNVLPIPKLDENGYILESDYTLNVDNHTSITIPKGYRIMDTKQVESAVTEPIQYLNILTPENIDEGIFVEDSNQNEFLWGESNSAIPVSEGQE